MFYSILVGEEPDSVFLKKTGEAEPSQDDMGRPFFLRQRSYHFRRNWGYISFQFPFKSFYLFPRPFFWELKTWNGQIPSLRNTYKKKDNGSPPIVLPRQNFELAILLPNRQRLTSVERLIHSDRYEDPTPLHCQNPCSIFEAGWPLCFSRGTILFLPSPLSPRSTEKKCRTGADSSSRKKELTEPGSLTNRIVLLTNTNI
jgi:hypothetical protein